MLQKTIPKKTKFKKYHKSKIKGKIIPLKLNYGNIGIYSLENFRITSKQIEAARKTILKYTKRQGNIYNILFADIPMTKKPEETRMGVGKGSVDHWIAKTKNGKMIFELNNIPKHIALLALKQVQYKLPIKTKIYEK